MKSAIRKILKNRNSKENLIVDRIIVLLASVVLSDVGTQLALTSPDFVAEQFKNNVKVGAAFVAGVAGVAIPAALFFLSAALPLAWKIGILIYGGTLSTSGISSYIQSMHPICDQHVLYLPELSKRFSFHRYDRRQQFG